MSIDRAKPPGFAVVVVLDAESDVRGQRIFEAGAQNPTVLAAAGFRVLQPVGLPEIVVCRSVANASVPAVNPTNALRAIFMAIPRTSLRNIPLFSLQTVKNGHTAVPIVSRAIVGGGESHHPFDKASVLVGFTGERGICDRTTVELDVSLTRQRLRKSAYAPADEKRLSLQNSKFRPHRSVCTVLTLSPLISNWAPAKADI